MLPVDYPTTEWPTNKKKENKKHHKNYKSYKNQHKRLHEQPEPSARTLATNELNQNTSGTNEGE
jgi:hypothetical protein